MLDLQTYTRQELITLFKTERIDSIKAKLQRQGYQFTTNGRGQTLTLTITELPLKFRNFCIEQLHFAPQTDFEKLKKFLYRFMLDDDFRQMPNKGMVELMKDDIQISNQTIGKWIQKLHKENIIGYGDYIYYSVYENHPNYCKRISAEAYKKAWELYWSNKEESYDIAIACMCSSIGGYPYKKEMILFNAFETEKIETLQKILRKEINADEQ